jgi:hypothetical protein
VTGFFFGGAHGLRRDIRDQRVVPVVPPGVAGVVEVPDGTLPGVAGGAGAGSVGMLDDGVGGVAGASSFLPHATSVSDASREAASRVFFITDSLKSGRLRDMHLRATARGETALKRTESRLSARLHRKREGRGK